MLDQAAELAGVGPFTAEQKKMMLDGLNDQRDAYAQIRALKIAQRCAAGVCVSSRSQRLRVEAPAGGPVWTFEAPA